MCRRDKIGENVNMEASGIVEQQMKKHRAELATLVPLPVSRKPGAAERFTVVAHVREPTEESTGTVLGQDALVICECRGKGDGDIRSGG